MEKKDFYFLGKITKTSGYSGNLVFFFDVDDSEKYHNLEAVFISVNEELIPFAIKELKFKSHNTAIAKLEDITSEEEALALAGNELFLPLSFLPPLTGKHFYYHEIIGFKTLDVNLGYLGIIDRIIDQSSQAIFVVRNKDKEILIPVSDEIIKKVDRKNKAIEVETPDGLIDIYL